MPTDDEITAARRELLARQEAGGGWAYRQGAPPCAEPTALAALALASEPGDDASTAAVRRAADALAKLQCPDGSIGVSATIPTPGWATPYALLVWSALGVHEAPRTAAMRWLLGLKGRVIDPREDPSHIAGHDTMLVGWPWVADTHSWLEPTALAVLALSRAGQVAHPRVREGLRLIRNRAVESGGWNYGNRAVFGRNLRAQPAPTGLALLALAGEGPRSEEIERGCAYLNRVLPDVRAASSLGWGLIGLRAWDATPSHADAWIAESIRALAGRPDAAPRLACLLLAANPGALDLFGRGPHSLTVSAGEAR
jgi:hypothetical protein